MFHQIHNIISYAKMFITLRRNQEHIWNMRRICLPDIKTFLWSYSSHSSRRGNISWEKYRVLSRQCGVMILFSWENIINSKTHLVCWVSLLKYVNWKSSKRRKFEPTNNFRRLTRVKHEYFSSKTYRLKLYEFSLSLLSIMSFC